MSNPVDAVELSSEIMFVLQERVRNNPDALPAGQLLAYGRDLAKLELARIAAKPPEAPPVELSPSDILAMDGIPADRKRQLLQEQYEKAFAEFQRIDAAITSLDERKDNDVQTA